MNAIDLFREEFGDDEADELLGTFPPSVLRALDPPEGFGYSDEEAAYDASIGAEGRDAR